MKRFFLTVIAVCLVPVCAFADYSSLSNDELKAEFNLIVSELVKRGIWLSDTLPGGLYIVGDSLPAGNYQLTAIKHDTVSIYPTIEDKQTGHNRILYLIFDDNETFTLTLKDGMVVDLGSPCTVKPFGFSW